MKKSELKRIIKEQIRNVIIEDNDYIKNHKKVPRFLIVKYLNDKFDQFSKDIIKNAKDDLGITDSKYSDFDIDVFDEVIKQILNNIKKTIK